jgi:hypothetical protein
MSGKLYGIALPEDDEDAMDEIRDFVQDGTPVIIFNDFDEADEYFTGSGLTGIGETVIRYDRNE